MAAFAADSAFDEAVTLGATLQFQSNFSLRAGSDRHFYSFLELFRLGPGSNERGKLAKDRSNLKRLARSVCCGRTPGRVPLVRIDRRLVGDLAELRQASFVFHMHPVSALSK